MARHDDHEGTAARRRGPARRWKQAAAVVAVGALTLGVAACGDDDTAGPTPTTGTTATDGDTTSSTAAGATTTPTTASAEGCTAERVGGEVTMGVGTLAPGLDPAVIAGSGAAGGHELMALYDTLVRWDPTTGDYEPHVAESLTPDDALTRWRLVLRPDVRFGSGNPLTTAEVQWNIERVLDPANRSPRRALAVNVAAMEIVDELTMDFVLTEPWGTFPFLLAEEAGMIVDPAVVTERTAAGFGLDPTGGGVGPFELVRFAPGEEVVLAARDDYWGGPVCIETLRFVSVPGAAATYDAFRNGELEVAWLGEPRPIAAAREDDVAGYSDITGGSPVLQINDGTGGTTPPTADVRVRQAIAQAVDLELFDERVNEGTGIPVGALVPPSSRYHVGGEGPPHDPAAAAELLAEVRAETGWDGRLTLACGTTPTATEQALTIEAMLEDVGFDIEVQAVAIGELIQRVVFDRNYQLACLGIAINEENPWVQLVRNYRSDSSFNYTGFADPAFDAGLDALKAASTLEEQRDALAVLQERWNETVPVVFLAASERFIVHAPEVHGLAYTVKAITRFDQAWLER